MKTAKNRFNIIRILLLIFGLLIFFSAGLNNANASENNSNLTIKTLEAKKILKKVAGKSANHKDKITSFLLSDDFCFHARKDSDNWQLSSQSIVPDIVYHGKPLLNKNRFHIQDSTPYTSLPLTHLTSQLLC